MKKIKKHKKLIFFIFSLLLFFYITTPSLNPFDERMFNFHDETQLGRVIQFALNIKSGKIPPRLAPDFSFHLGMPIFNFYAPFSYWVTAGLNLIGIPVVCALKTSFFLAFLLSFLGILFFLSLFFDFLPSLLGATLYVTSTYFATEILIRGNLAECWYLALLPFSLGFLVKNSRRSTKFNFFATTIILSFTLTVHNIFSAFSFPLFLVIIFLLPKKKNNFLAFFIACLISGFFWIPLIFESKFINVAKNIKYYFYSDHFLCPWQLWRSNGWGFGASLPGCDTDLMSFKLGKIQLVLAGLGIFLFSVKFKKEKNKFLFGLVFFLTLASLFMTLYQSQFVWNLFSGILATMQFPWRFLLFSMFGISFFGAYFFQNIEIPFKEIFIFLLIIFSFTVAKKYIVKPLYPKNEYLKQYGSEEYISKKLAYMIPEYITPQTDYTYWSEGGFKIKKTKPFEKKIVAKEPKTITLNIHYFPYWKIFVNQKEIIPATFDKLGRPVLTIEKPSTIEVFYHQTTNEKIGNLVSVIGLLILLISIFN